MSRRMYLVTGGSGFIGSSLVNRLIQSGHNVRVLDNQSRGSMERLSEVREAIEFVEADIRDPQAVMHATRGVDAVCHLAFVNGTEFFYTKPDLVLEVAVKGIVNVIDACRACGVDQLTLVSSSEVYQTPPIIPTPETVPLSIPDPLNPRYSYAAGKIISEIMAINFGRTAFERVVIVRPHNVYGPDMGREHVIPQVTSGVLSAAATTPGGASAVPVRIQGTGKETRAFVFIDDFTAGLLLAMERGDHLGIYHVGTEQEITIASLVERIGHLLGVQVEVIPGEAPSGGTPRRCPDISRLRELGFEPQVSLTDGLTATVTWYEQQYRRENMRE